MTPKHDQRNAVAETIRMLLAAGTPLDGVAQIVWSQVAGQMLDLNGAGWERLVHVFRLTDLRGTIHEVRWAPNGARSSSERRTTRHARHDHRHHRVTAPRKGQKVLA